MTALVVKVGECSELNKCLDVIVDYFEKCKIKYHIHTEKSYNLHPSWYKLKAFDFIEDDFVLSWDLDLLPKKNAESILPFLNFSKINLALDTAVILKNLNFLNEQKHFRYNCGLMGIPKTYRNFCNYIFEFSKDKTPSLQFPNPSPTEQDIINEMLYLNNFSDVHEIDPKFNTLYYTEPKNFKNIISSKCIHYTSYFLQDNPMRKVLIEKHCNNYFK